MTTPAPLPFEDSIGAWVPHGKFSLPPTASGPLTGLSFAVKDVFDVAGHPTGAGNPHWLATHPIPERHSPVVAQLLAAGATLHGKTLTDELAYSIHGDNLHYGMPLNSAAPERIPGGSSSGSVAAVAAHLVDFALGTDTGGSTRVPASYCGVWGLRTTHGLLSRDGLVPLHPGFDTATWFAHDAGTFERVGQVLLPPSTFSAARLLVLRDACGLAEETFQPALQAVRSALADLCPHTEELDLAAPQSLEHWRQTYVTAGAFEGWLTHGDWISQHVPGFAPAIAARWQQAASVSQDQAEEAFAQRAAIRARVRASLGTDGIALLPSAASVAPLRTAGGAEIDEIRLRTLRIGCIAGLAGLPQVSIPLRSAAGLPIGISLLGPAGSDLALIRLARQIHQQLAA
ncbi:amidase [Uliginosibacterium aquaticum]|uniref:Amidase n=1 Tax=Uliginosibacterium aquaticum TaxID=2731212 RepID=A0ABX2IC71_9RHOO|nr:amidase [Uliginosibacterium aquaticum]NSL53913.1 amidase [Uliginosibacterium aquaticum]